jgi:hypothetical protein
VPDPIAAASAALATEIVTVYVGTTAASTAPSPASSEAPPAASLVASGVPPPPVSLVPLSGSVPPVLESAPPGPLEKSPRRDVQPPSRRCTAAKRATANDLRSMRMTSPRKTCESIGLVGGSTKFDER